MKFLISFIAFLASPIGVAIESDQKQPIRIQADTAIIKENKGVSIYKGDVLIVQGTLEIRADNVEITTINESLLKIVAKSTNLSEGLAKYKQRLDEKEDMVFAEAQQISYLVQDGLLHLSGNAKLKQRSDFFSGELLYYDIRRGIVNLDSGETKGRVNMTITPRKIDKK